MCGNKRDIRKRGREEKGMRKKREKING